MHLQKVPEPNPRFRFLEVFSGDVSSTPKGIRCATGLIPESVNNCLWLAIAPWAIPTIFSRFVERAERVDALAARGAR